MTPYTVAARAQRAGIPARIPRAPRLPSSRGNQWQLGRALSLRRRDRAGFSPVFPVAARPDDRPGTRVLSFPYLVLILKQIDQIILHLVHPVNRHFADIAVKECHNRRVLRGGPKRRGAWRSPWRGLGRASGGRPISPRPNQGRTRPSHRGAGWTFHPAAKGQRAQRSGGPLDDRRGRCPLPGSKPSFPAATGDRTAADPAPLSGAKGSLLQTPP